MWELLFLVGLAATGIYAVAIVIQFAREQARSSRIAHEQMVRREHAQAVALKRRAEADSARQQAARNLQLAIQQLQLSPDFRRAASFAAKAAQAGVPAEFRRRQFSRLRVLLVEHLTRQLQADVSLEIAAAGLRELIGGLGVASFEADYIANEAQERQQPKAMTTPSYRDRLQQFHAEHQRRLEAIQNTANLEEELRTQLLEAEHERFRRELLHDPELEQGA